MCETLISLWDNLLIQNLQDALDEEIAAHEETERKYSDLKMEFSTAKMEMSNAKGKPRRYSSATISVSNFEDVAF